MGVIKKVLSDKSFVYFNGNNLVKFEYSYNYFLNYNIVSNKIPTAFELVTDFRGLNNQPIDCFYFYNANVLDNIIYLFDGKTSETHIVNFTDKPLELLYEKYPDRVQEIFDAYNIGFEILIEKL